jgi:hypothetical protein
MTLSYQVSIQVSMYASYMFLIVECSFTDLSIIDLYTVNVNLVSVVHLWREFGLALGLTPATLERIRSNNLKDVDCCFTGVLAAWLNGEDTHHDSPCPNWGEVVAALKSPSVNMQDCAQQVVQNLAS